MTVAHDIIQMAVHLKAVKGPQIGQDGIEIAAVDFCIGAPLHMVLVIGVEAVQQMGRNR